MKQVKHTVLKKKDIFNGLILKRARTRKYLKYIGEYKVGDTVFTGEVDLDITTYHQNKEDLTYIDNFAKDEIVKNIIKQINGN